MRVTFQGRFLSSEYIWFEEFSKYSDIKRLRSHADNVVVWANSLEIQGKYVGCNKQESLVSVLEGGMDSIMKKFSSTTRNEIRRAERENVEVCFYLSNDIIREDKVLDRMALLYKNMYEEKGMNNVVLPLNELRAYAQNDCLLISAAQIDNEEVVFHSYFVSENKARLLHSCSEFRVVDNAMRNAIGRANKYLHYKDMDYLNQLGVNVYDWGGISSSAEPNGIDKFKMSFGGEMVEYYNLRYARSIKQRVFDRVINRKAH